ncbi:cobyric acid synthase [bacterium]|nr:cobyric acid synthase [bacterium]
MSARDETGAGAPGRRPARRARPLMVQGTMSNVGKTLVVAGLCRALARRGLAVAPFKSQNMALNSGVTADGLEMGRAQILQAQAAGVEPSVLMNPILLKPTSDVGSQVIVRGRAVATMRAREYARHRPRLASVVRDAYDELAATCDAVVIEGAGSPAEINLGRDEFVNMGMARIADAPVILVGDIDPGGVFAQLCGTLDLLEPADRARVRGIVINKFRGDPAILAPGLRQLEGLTGVPVLGVLPYLRLDLDDEDSLADRLARPRARAGRAPVDVAVVRLPHLSNFTDFNELERHPAVAVRYVSDPWELARPDLVVVPGTKTTMDDLRWLRATGMAGAVRALARAGTPTLGICGGYQILGQELRDEAGDDGGGVERGLGLLPVRTTFTRAKRTRRVTVRAHVGAGPFACLDGRALAGYEIHAGVTRRVEADAGAARATAPLTIVGADGAQAPDGCAAGSVLGTYVHGILDAAPAVDALVRALLAARGLDASTAACAPDARATRERELDRLADAIEASLDMGAVCAMMGLRAAPGGGEGEVSERP